MSNFSKLNMARTKNSEYGKRTVDAIESQRIRAQAFAAKSARDTAMKLTRRNAQRRKEKEIQKKLESAKKEKAAAEKMGNKESKGLTTLAKAAESVVYYQSVVFFILF